MKRDHILKCLQEKVAGLQLAYDLFVKSEQRTWGNKRDTKKEDLLLTDLKAYRRQVEELSNSKKEIPMSLMQCLLDKDDPITAVKKAEAPEDPLERMSALQTSLGASIPPASGGEPGAWEKYAEMFPPKMPEWLIDGKVKS